MEVIAIFDIGKTNKKILLFDYFLNLVHQEEFKLEEITDDDGFPCDDIEKIESWILYAISKITYEKFYEIKAINFTTYGASLIYLDKEGKRLTPIYNYLKPMPDDVLDGFYAKYGGIDEFSRTVASPPLGMLNSGLQILWLKRKKPEIYSNVNSILHFPQYLSFLLTGKKVSEYTSIGCHTAMWNFDQNEYHQWLAGEEIFLPHPVSNAFTFHSKVSIGDQLIPVGIGIHDSSASLVPYLESGNEKFILISTGTWCIFMNPFNDEPLTRNQLENDTLCYLSAHERQVKSSRLFLGHIFEVNVKRISDYFGLPEDTFKSVNPNEMLLKELTDNNKWKPVFFKAGIPPSYLDDSVDLSLFDTFERAYHQLMLDISKLALKSMQLIIPAKDETKRIYISGGFAHNKLFTRLMATLFGEKEVYTSEIENSTALGAAMALKPSLKGLDIKKINLNLKRINGLNIEI